MLIETEDDSTFQLIEQQEREDPTKPILDGAHPVYRSRAASTGITGTPILTDFGKARSAERINGGSAMPDLYRAPEVLLGLPWNYPTDMWSVGIMVRISVVGAAIDH